MTGEPPYVGLHPCVIQYRQSTGEAPPLPADASADALEFLHACFRKEQNERATCTQLKRMRFLLEPAAWKKGENVADYGTKTQMLSRDTATLRKQRERRETIGGADLEALAGDGFRVNPDVVAREMK